jgi:hypothetical protein
MLNNDMYYNFPDNGCSHDKYEESKCEWESDGNEKYNTIRECCACHGLAETNVKIRGK